MRRALVLVFALAVGGGVAATLLLPGSSRSAAVMRPVPAAPDRAFVVGFLDDVSFRFRPYRARMLDRAEATGARLIRAVVYWNHVAPERPARGALPFDEPRLYELDELVWQASTRGMEVLLTIWGTPEWANGGRTPNYPPAHARDLQRFAHALAARYPQVRRFAVWNEPNAEMFLAPQFDAAGRSVAPYAYARLYRAAYRGIKSANPGAMVAMGETSSHGRDVPSEGGVQDSHSPVRFAWTLSRIRPQLRFDAWGHHPYPTTSTGSPDAPWHWPDVTLTSLDWFGRALDRWFGRTEIPLWVTEFGYEAAPDEPVGLSPETQATYAARAIERAASVPRVELFVWFTFRDDHANRWQSGLLDSRGRARPAYAHVRSVTRALARSPEP